MKRVLFGLGLAGFASLSLGQAIITDGTSSFGWTSQTALSAAANRTGTDGGNTNTFISSGSADQAFQQWWWYRVNGVNTREFALSTQANAPVVSGNNMVLTYREPEGFTSRLEYTINNIGGRARVTGTNFVKNEGNTTLDFDFFNYIDYDMNGTAAGDLASLQFPNPVLRMNITDPAGTLAAEWRVLDADAFQIGAFAGVRNLLTNSTLDDLNNTGDPFGPGDFSAAVQWRFTLAPGEQIALQTTQFLTTPVPEPATMAALGLGILAIARRRRKS